MRLIDVVTAMAMITASMAAPIPEKESGWLARRGIDLNTIGEIASAFGEAMPSSSKPKKSKNPSSSPTLSDLGTTNYGLSDASYTYDSKPKDFFSRVAKNINKFNGKPSLYDDDSYGYGYEPSTYDMSSSLSRSMTNFGSSSSSVGRGSATVSGGNGVYNLPPSVQPPKAPGAANNAAAVPGSSSGGAVFSTPPTVDTSAYPGSSASSNGMSSDAVARMRASMDGSSSADTSSMIADDRAMLTASGDVQ